MARTIRNQPNGTYRQVRQVRQTRRQVRQVRQDARVKRSEWQGSQFDR